MSAQKCATNCTRVSQHPSKNKQIQTKQLVAHLEVKVGEHHKLEASLGYSETWSQRTDNTYCSARRLS